MQEITIRHEMSCDEDTYWYKCVFNAEYNDRLYLTELKFHEYVTEKLVEDAATIQRVVRVTPRIPPLPGPVKKVIGDGLAYTERGTFDRAKRRYDFTATPNSLADRATTEGHMFVEMLGEQRIARVARIRVDVKVFMVGGLIEDQILNSLRSSYDRAASFTNEFVKEKGLSVPGS
jgi:hypothetical protein